MCGRHREAQAAAEVAGRVYDPEVAGIITEELRFLAYPNQYEQDKQRFDRLCDAVRRDESRYLKGKAA